MKTLKDFEQDAGKELADLVLEFFENDTNGKQKALDWFYTSKPEAFFGETPFEYCHKEGTKPLYSRLICILQGNCSS